MSDPIVVSAAVRTPLGRFRGELSHLPGPRLGAAAIRAAVQRAGLDGAAVDEVLMGSVLQAGQGQAPARQAMRYAGLPDSTGAVTVNKVCGSGMKAAMLAADALQLGHAAIAVAGGMESMTNAPHLLPGARAGYAFGHRQVLDHAAHDGLEDPYSGGRAMGAFGEDTAAEYQMTRADQDAFAMDSVRRAQAAWADGAFADEVIALDAMSQDEGPRRLDAAKIPTLKPAFRPDGTITAASSSGNADGAAALVLTRRSVARAHGLPVLATVLGHATHSQAPERFTTAPIPAIAKLAERIGRPLAGIDLFEINEAFACVPMAAMRDLGLPREKVNVHGGACALGHPIGATGARILVTLLHALRRRGGGAGIAALCIGGGEATAMALSTVD